VTGHLLNAREGRAGDLVAAESGVDADENAGLSHEVSTKPKGVSDSGDTHVIALVERGGRHTRGDGRAGAGDFEVDALGPLATTLFSSRIFCLPEGSSERR
jgi:hypothetical protein